MHAAELLSHATTFLAHDGELAWVFVLETEGSAPRHAGASMLVRRDGSSVGSVGGGPVEAYALKHAREVLKEKKSRTVRFVLEGLPGVAEPEQAPAAPLVATPGNRPAAANVRSPAHLDMTCGGRGSLLVLYVSAEHAAWAAVLAAAQAATNSGQQAWLAVTLPMQLESSAPTAEEVALVGPDGAVAGCASLADLVHQKVACAPAHRPLPVHGPLILERGDQQVFVLPMAPKEQLYVFGAGHCAQPLATIASMVGFSVTVIDDRPEFANPERFPSADRVIVCPTFEQALLDLPITKDSYLVIMTRGHQHDKTVLAQALRTPACYIGMIGSKKKVAEIFNHLQTEGISAEKLEQVHAPIGLDIGSETPEEIAVSIAAELIQERARRRATRSTAQSLPTPEVS
ncbi:MAG: XdhC/CoxI family protein [Thermoleophilia bacterium]|nr:XdhC/CoxI family protein [Thermoleophilia bacterium]